ncbi:unnamed protein product [Amoebophrya sp. A25]|nr:unnamed protein product [Amoebophrya sp. A25]|eukprot:GSA25T00017308001.1
MSFMRLATLFSLLNILVVVVPAAHIRLATTHAAEDQLQYGQDLLLLRGEVGESSPGSKDETSPNQEQHQGSLGDQDEHTTTRKNTAIAIVTPSPTSSTRTTRINPTDVSDLARSVRRLYLDPNSVARLASCCTDAAHTIREEFASAETELMQLLTAFLGGLGDEGDYNVAESRPAETERREDISRSCPGRGTSSSSCRGGWNKRSSSQFFSARGEPQNHEKGTKHLPASGLFAGSSSPTQLVERMSEMHAGRTALSLDQLLTVLDSAGMGNAGVRKKLTDLLYSKYRAAGDRFPSTLSPGDVRRNPLRRVEPVDIGGGPRRRTNLLSASSGSCAIAWPSQHRLQEQQGLRRTKHEVVDYVGTTTTSTRSDHNHNHTRATTTRTTSTKEISKDELEDVDADDNKSLQNLLENKKENDYREINRNLVEKVDAPSSSSTSTCSRSRRSSACKQEQLQAQHHPDHQPQHQHHSHHALSARFLFTSCDLPRRSDLSRGCIFDIVNLPDFYLKIYRHPLGLTNREGRDLQTLISFMPKDQSLDVWDRVLLSDLSIG